MEYKKLLEEILPKVFAEVEKDILKENGTLNFIKNKETLKKLLAKQEKLITTYLKNFPEASDINTRQIELFYHDLKVPYIVVSRNIELIKVKLLERVSIDKEINSPEFLLNLKNYIEKLENIIAREYIKNEILNLKNLENSIFKDFLLYKAHIPYIKKVVNSIENEELSQFPLIDATECEFQKYLYYPESIMACMDANLCKYIENLHNLLHEMANSFFIFYMNGNYKDAYISFKEFSNTMFKLAKVLSELYFSTYADAETNLFKLTRYMEHLFDRGFLILIDVKNLRVLNKIYTEDKVNLVLKQIDETLKEYIDNKRKNFVYVRGVTANFYMFAIDVDDETLDSTLKEIKRIIEKNYKLNGHFTEIKVNIAALEFDKYSENTYEDLIKILQHIKSKAKNMPDNIYVVIKEKDKEDIRNWLNQVYRDSVYIQNKLKKEEIDVVFQPIYDIKTRKIKHLEVLARIKDKQDKLIPAGIFIDLIHELGLISRLDSIILEKVLEKKKFISKVSSSLFLNISSESLTSVGFLDKLSGFIKDMPEFDITFEITEQKLIEDVSALEDIYQKSGKVRIAIDDFGTGYSSLRVVAEMAEKGILDVVKIDGALIKDIPKRKFVQKVVKAISSMSANLGVETVAEFVENEEVLKILQDLGIQDAQGYYLSKPKKIDELLLKKI